MSFLLKVNQFISMAPLIVVAVPAFFALVAMAALYHLKLALQLREQSAARQLLSVELRKLSTAVEQSPASVVITDRAGVIEYVNPAFCRLTGYALDEALGQNPKLLKGGDLPPEVYQPMWDALVAGTEWRGEFHNKRKDGTSLWETASITPIRDEMGEITHFVGVKEDITERKLLLENLEQRAHYDKLTGLPNRALFFDRLSCVEALSRREGRSFALLYIDLDGFKQVNEKHGQEAGDAVLRKVAERLTACIRDSDTAARMGGDEFTVILGNVFQESHAALVAEKILQTLSAPIILPGGIHWGIGASIGISLYPDDGLSSEMLVNAADSAMYEVKREGESGYRFYSVTQIPAKPGRASLTLC